MRNRYKLAVMKLRATVAKAKAPETLFVASVATIVAGVAAVYWPASLMVAGALTGGITFAYVRKAGKR